MKKYLAILILLLISVTCTLPATAAGNQVVFTIAKSAYTSNGQTLMMDAAPFIENGRTYVPLRYLALSLGIPVDKITWNPAGQIGLEKDGAKISLTVGSTVQYINNEPKIMDVAPVNLKGRVYLPARWIAETLGYQVAWNPDIQSVVLHPVSTKTTPPVYRHLLIIYPNTDVVYIKDGKSQRFAGTMSTSLKTTVSRAFKNLPSLINDASAGAASSTCTIIEVPRPVTKLTSLGSNYYWLSSQDIQGDLALYAPNGKYDSVHVIWNNGPIDSSWGFGGIFINGGTATYSSLIAGQDYFWTGTGGEVFLHEWLHGVCRFYANLGYTMPARDADGAELHGYVNSESEGWMGYYRDLMQGKVREPGLSQHTGITKEAWYRGTPTQH